MEENKKDEIQEMQEEKNTNQEKKKFDFIHNENFVSVIETIILIIIIIGAFSSGCIRCTTCGADDNRLIIYASGVSEDGYKYKSCVGPAGILGFGLNTKCWPTECMQVNYTDSSNVKLSGCINYYNTAGCIAKSDVKSEGKYTNSLGCLTVSCIGNKYIETTAETTKATQKNKILGMSCGGSTVVEPKYYNDKMPRQFMNGCWSSE